MPITLYYFETSPPCQAVLVTARALGVQLQVHDIDFIGREHNTPQYLMMNPAATVPTIDDDGFYLWESRAIMAYLCDRYGQDDKLYPRDPKQRAVINNMMQFDMGALYPNFIRHFYSMMFHDKAEDLGVKAKMVERLEILDGILGERPYVAGDHLTIADISQMCSLHLAMYFHFDYSPYAHIVEWRERVKRVDLPFFDQLTEKGVKSFDDFAVKKKAMKMLKVKVIK